MEMVEILLLVKKLKQGNTLQLEIGLHCFPKKSLNSLAFSAQFTMKALLTKRGGIFGARHLFITLFIIFQ